MRKHRHQIGTLAFFSAFVPQTHEVFQTFVEFRLTRFLAFDDARFFIPRRHIRPTGQLASILKRKVE